MNLTLQDALFKILSNDEFLQKETTGIYDEVPEQEPFPFVVIGDAITIPIPVFESVGYETTPTIHVFDQTKGMKNLERIMNRIDELLDKVSFPLSEKYMLVYSWRESFSVVREQDGLTRHGLLRYKMRYE